MSIMARLNQLKKNKGAQKYFKNTFWLLGEKVLRLAVGLFVGVWVARYLGPDKFGLLSYAQSFVALFSVFATLGLNGIIIRELVKDDTPQDKLLGTGFFLKLLGAIFVLVLLYFSILFSGNDNQTNQLIFILASSTVFQSFNVIDFYFQSRVLSKFVVFSNLISLLISSLVKIYLIFTNAPLVAFAYVALFDSFILAIGFIYFYFTSGARIKKWRFDTSLAISLLKDSWPLILSSFVITIYMRVDQLMLKSMINSEAVGQYAAAVRLSEAWYFIPIVICSSLFPAVLNAKERSEKLYYERLQKLYDLMVWIAISIAIPVSFLASGLVDFLYGEQYSQASDVLVIHMWSAVFVFLGVASGNWFIAENLQKYSFYRTIAGAFINVILNYILIPQYGIYGAAIATLLSQLVSSYLFNLFNKKLRITFLLQTNAFLLPLRKLGIKF